MHSRWPWLLLLLLLAFASASGCARYPADPEHTTQRVRGDVMRVGLIHDPPFVNLRDAPRPRGSEVRMVRAMARSLDARVDWVEGSQDALFEDLHQYRLDLVIGGVSPQSPWRGHVALTLPYFAHNRKGWLVKRVAALPPGENRWQMQVERFQRSPQARRILRDGAGAADAAGGIR